MTHPPLPTVVRFLSSSRAAQIALLTAIWLGGCGVARGLGLPIPGGLIGMMVLLWLLASGTIAPQLVERGAAWLLAEMLLFFVPAVVALLAHPEFLGLMGLKVLVVILGSTVMVMLATALTVDLGLRLLISHARPAAALE